MTEHQCEMAGSSPRRVRPNGGSAIGYLEERDFVVTVRRV